MILLLKDSFKWQYMAGAGAKEKKFRLCNTDLANLVVLWSKLADLGNLAILMLLADLADL